MQSLVSQTVALFAVLLLVSSLGTFKLYRQSIMQDLLLPREQSVFPWHIVTTTDASRGGTSEIMRSDTLASFGFSFILTDDDKYPYVSYAVDFAPYSRPEALVNWERYDEFRAEISCSPENILSFAIHTYDEEVTSVVDPASYRIAETNFLCSSEPNNVKIKLKNLKTPDWWLRHYDVDYSEQDYRLDKVLSFSLRNSSQSPTDVLTNVEITSASLHGIDWRYIYVAIAFNVAMWSIFAYCYLRKKNAVSMALIPEKIQEERQLVAYQQVPDETKEDRLKNTVLKYLTAHYADQELNLDMVAADLGISRTKINAYLKSENGLTFTGYINRLRLTEAARLLLNQGSSIAEVAYQVGYNNPSYFATVFKKEYACSPGEFRRMMAK